MAEVNDQKTTCSSYSYSSCSDDDDDDDDGETHFPEGFFPFPNRYSITITGSSRADLVGQKLTPIPMHIKWLEGEEEDDDDDDIVHVLYSHGIPKIGEEYGTLVACSSEESAEEIYKVQNLYWHLLRINFMTPCSVASIYYPKKKTETAFLFYPSRLVSLQSFLKKQDNESLENGDIYSRLCRDILASMKYLYDEVGSPHGNFYNGICVNEKGEARLWRIAQGTSDSLHTDFVDLCKILELMNPDKNPHLMSFYEFVRLRMRSPDFESKSIIWVCNHPYLCDSRGRKRFLVNLYYCAKYGLDNNKYFIDVYQKKNLCRFVKEAGENDRFLRILELEDDKKRICVYLYNVLTKYNSYGSRNIDSILFVEPLINLMLEYHPLVIEDLYECCFAAFSHNFSCYLCPNAKVFLSDSIGV